MPLDVEIRNIMPTGGWLRERLGGEQNDVRVRKKYDMQGQASSPIYLGVIVYCPRNLGGFRFSEITYKDMCLPIPDKIL